MTCTRMICVPVVLALVVLAVGSPAPAQTTQPAAADPGLPTVGQTTQPVADQPLSLEQLGQQGADALAAGDAATAIKAFQVLVQTQPNNVGALLGLAEAYVKAQNPLQAMEMYNRCCKIAPNEWRAEYGLGTIYLQQNYYRMARPYLERAVVRAPAQPEARGRVAYNLALTYRGLHDLPAAIEQARSTLALDSSNVDARRLLITLHAEADRLDDALAEVRATLDTIQGKLAKTPDDRATVEQMAQVLSTWSGLLGKQIAAKPDEPSLRLQMAFVLEQLAIAGQQMTWYAALEQVDAALKKAPANPDVLFAHGRLQYLVGRTGGAVEDLRAALKAAPAHVQAKDLLEKIESTTTKPADK